MSDLVPVLPESAPFTPEQRAYLNGYFAGLFSRAPFAAPADGPDSGANRLRPLTILFGSQTGTAEGLAKRAGREAGKRGFAPTLQDLSEYPPENLKSEAFVLLITSTYGDGEPPDNAKSFWEALGSDAAPRLTGLNYSVLALGDSNYPRFCECGKMFDSRFETLGAHRIHPRVDCDVDYEEPFLQWLNGVLAALGETSPATVKPPPRVGADGNGQEPASAASSRATSFPARLSGNHVLNAPGSAKETRHFEISLEGSDPSYEAGDAVGVYPTNCPRLVDEIIAALGADRQAPVPVPGEGQEPLREALLSHYEITRIPRPLLERVAERSNDKALLELAGPAANGELDAFLRGREVIDLLLAFPHVKFSPAEFISLLRRIQPRLYSVSSSPKAYPAHVHLTVSVVRYRSLGRERNGVCSAFLADRAGDGTFPLVVRPNPNFRPPVDNSQPMIMVGPGTGIAPFRAFLQERKAIGATGKNWLFFGDQRARTDFLYRDELEAFVRENILTRLDTAFSRDQEQKIYVQHRMLEHARELFEWLEAGAHFYVCGDASRMAKDVDAALHRVIETGGGRTPEQAAAYVRQLKTGRRYQRDVY
jgi:sulfite reductase (NADPH) flavoprotein alpha-component